MILLFSGGVDSYIAWHYLNKPPTVYFDLGSRYTKRELEAVKKLVPDTIIDNSLNIGDREIGEKAYVPHRNLMLSCLANKYSDDIVIAGIQDDVVSDKNESIFIEFSKMLSKLENRSITVTSPFWDRTKSQVVEWYLQQDLSKINLYGTFSCYAKESDLDYCGECSACFRKFVAFQLNNLEISFFNRELASKYYHEAMYGVNYTHERNEGIIKVFKFYFGV